SLRGFWAGAEPALLQPARAVITREQLQRWREPRGRRGRLLRRWWWARRRRRWARGWRRAAMKSLSVALVNRNSIPHTARGRDNRIADSTNAADSSEPHSSARLPPAIPKRR